MKFWLKLMTMYVLGVVIGTMPAIWPTYVLCIVVGVLSVLLLDYPKENKK